MKKIYVFCFLLLIGHQVFAQIKSGQIKGIVTFAIKNFGLSTKGGFGEMAGNINFDPQNLDNSRFEVTVNSNTINTNNKTRDKHLRSDDYFDVDSYPTINFKSIRISAVDEDYQVMGELTIKSKTQRVTIPFSYSNENGNAVFNGTLDINRLDYGVGKSSWTLADNVKIKIKAIVN